MTRATAISAETQANVVAFKTPQQRSTADAVARAARNKARPLIRSWLQKVEVEIQEKRLAGIDGRLAFALTNFPSANEGECWAGQDRLAKTLGRCERTVRSSIRRLELAGFLVTKQRGLNKTSRYTFILDGKTMIGREVTLDQVFPRAAFGINPTSGKESGRPFSDVKAIWPAEHVLSFHACEGAHAGLNHKDQEAAYHGVKAYLAECLQKNRKLCDLATYYRERRWERFAQSEMIRPPKGCKVRSPQWHRWREYRLATGQPVAFMDAYASNHPDGIWSVEPTEWPPQLPRPSSEPPEDDLLCPSGELSEQGAPLEAVAPRTACVIREQRAANEAAAVQDWQEIADPARQQIAGLDRKKVAGPERQKVADYPLESDPLEIKPSEHEPPPPYPPPKSGNSSCDASGKPESGLPKEASDETVSTNTAGGGRKSEQAVGNWAHVRRALSFMHIVRGRGRD